MYTQIHVYVYMCVDIGISASLQRTMETSNCVNEQESFLPMTTVELPQAFLTTMGKWA